jgi:hypothetical protein
MREMGIREIEIREKPCINMAHSRINQQTVDSTIHN